MQVEFYVFKSEETGDRFIVDGCAIENSFSDNMKKCVEIASLMFADQADVTREPERLIVEQKEDGSVEIGSVPFTVIEGDEPIIGYLIGGPRYQAAYARYLETQWNG